MQNLITCPDRVCVTTGTALVCSNFLSLCPRPSSRSDTSSAWWWKSSGRPKIMNTGTHEIHSFIHSFSHGFVYSFVRSGLYRLIHLTSRYSYPIYLLNQAFKLNIHSASFKALIYSFIDSIRPFIQSFTMLSCIDLLIYFFSQAFIHSFIMLPWIDLFIYYSVRTFIHSFIRLSDIDLFSQAFIHSFIMLYCIDLFIYSFNQPFILAFMALLTLLSLVFYFCLPLIQ